MRRIGVRTMWGVGTVLLSCAVLALAIAAGRACLDSSVRGEMQLVLSDGRRIPARYEVHWGRFLWTPHLEEQGLLDRLSTLRFAGRIESLENPPLICEFETRGQRVVVGSGLVTFTTLDTASRRAAGEADYVSLPGHAVFLRWAELGTITTFDQQADAGGTGVSGIAAWRVHEKVLHLTLSRYDAEHGWIPMGSAVARRR